MEDLSSSFPFVVKEGNQLTPDEEKSVNAAKAREWNLSPMDDDHKQKHLFCLLKDGDGEVLAQCQLLVLHGVSFDNETYSVGGIGGVIANEKGRGYGKALMEKVLDYLKEQNLTALGFTSNDLIGFYEKCGLKSNHEILKRFVYMKDGKKVTNSTDDCVLYLDTDDKLIEKVIDSPDGNVLLPREPDW